MNKFRKILEHSLRLASSDNLDEALRQLNVGVRAARKEEDLKWVVLLAKNVGLLFEMKGKLDRAKASYRLALKYSKPDPYLHYSLADICQRLGQSVAARRHFAACQMLAIEQNEKDLLEILKRNSRQLGS
jgi:Flp pilus assembly protein TadD